MNFCQPYPTTRQSNLGNAYSLAPPTTAVQLSKTFAVTNSFAGRNRLNSSYLADYFKVHREELTRYLYEPHNVALERLAQVT
jgi:hypothetical protein